MKEGRGKHYGKTLMSKKKGEKTEKISDVYMNIAKTPDPRWRERNPQKNDMKWTFDI